VGHDPALIAGMRVLERPVRCAIALVLATLIGAAACRQEAPSSSASPAVEAYDVAGKPAGWLALPVSAHSIKFAVIGDSGRGWQPQHDVAHQMAAYRERFPFRMVLMLGDNIYEGPASPEDYRVKFEEPYQALLDEGVRFYAVLGNHDDPRQRFYPAFNMNGERYYTFRPPADPLTKLTEQVRVFALDSTSLDAAQLAWLDRELGRSRERWKICVLHHPLYTSGRYTTQSRLTRWRLESLFVRHGVDVVLSGHEHIYQRSTLQQGVQYFISGGAGSLRRGDADRASYIARSLDSDFHFMLMEIDGDRLHFQAITRAGLTADAGVIRQP
jgi:predicted phosphodiesterase